MGSRRQSWGGALGVLALGLLLSVGTLPTGNAERGAREGDAGPTMTSEEHRFLELVNAERARRGLPRLSPNPLLVAVARNHSREMAEKEYFAHKSPTPGHRTPMDRYLKAVRERPAYACVGENLYYSTKASVERGHEALMESPSHRANILHPPFREAGVGIYKAATGEFWVTELFLTTES